MTNKNSLEEAIEWLRTIYRFKNIPIGDSARKHIDTLIDYAEEQEEIHKAQGRLTTQGYEEIKNSLEGALKKILRKSRRHINYSCNYIELLESFVDIAKSALEDNPIQRK